MWFFHFCIAMELAFEEYCIDLAIAGDVPGRAAYQDKSFPADT